MSFSHYAVSALVVTTACIILCISINYHGDFADHAC